MAGCPGVKGDGAALVNGEVTEVTVCDRGLL